MQRPAYLFIDRDGTLISEPKDDFQIDRLEKFKLVPGAISALKLFAAQGFRLFMVTNQDGLGTPSFPEDTFWPYQNLLVDILASEGISWNEVFIDKSLPEQGLPTRKPGTGMLTHLLADGSWDRSRSWTIGDRLTDAQLAHNLGVNSLLLLADHADAGAALQAQHQAWLQATQPAGHHLLAHSWPQATAQVGLHSLRSAHVHRRTAETDVEVRLAFDGSGLAQVSTGIGFFDHMLEQIARHGLLNLFIQAKGDLHIDQHHTIEDVAITLGQAISQATGFKGGINRYAFVLAMDEAQATIALDLSNRPYLTWDVPIHSPMVGAFPTAMAQHFFHSLAVAAGITLQVQATGTNDHHIIEAIFKGVAKCLHQATQPMAGATQQQLPSTKNML